MINKMVCCYTCGSWCKLSEKTQRYKCPKCKSVYMLDETGALIRVKEQRVKETGNARDKEIR